MNLDNKLLFERYDFKQKFITEGGAAGHMAHPYDLPDVTNGAELVRKFEEIPDLIDRLGGVVKIDGTNVSIKLVENEQGEKEFALDRGSTIQLDIDGVTINRLERRFKPGHGMIESGKIILKIFNTALPQITNELRALKMWDDPTKFINSEFVRDKSQGTLNIVEYDKNFLALHNISQFFEKTNRSTGAQRPGMKRPATRDEAGKEIVRPEYKSLVSVPVKNFNHQALNSLAEKVEPIARQYNFDIFTQIPVAKVKEPNYGPTLQQEIKINVSGNPPEEQSKTLMEWLSEAKNPKNAVVTTVSGKKINPLGKENFDNVFNSGRSLVAMYGDDENNRKAALDGAIIYKATVELGQEVKDSYSSDLAQTSTDQEGIVVYLHEPKFKITGDFPLKDSPFRLMKTAQAEQDEQTAPGISFNKGYQNVNAQSANYNASSKDPGGTPYTRNPGPGKGVYFQ